MTLEFWFDFASTYSYLAVERVEAAAAKASVTLSWHPFLLGPIFQSQLGFADSPYNRNLARGQYMWRDMERQTTRLGLRFRRPTVFPRHSVLAARVACVALDEPWGADFVRAVFRANFGGDRDIASDAVLTDILAALGRDIDATAVLARATAPEHKDRLRRATDEAARRGVFGAPTFFAGDEMFFGNERLDEALECAKSASVRD